MRDAYTASIDEPADDTPCACSDCGKKGLTFGDLMDIDDCELTPGDASPAGRCPNCDSLAYVVTPKTIREDASEETLKALKDLYETMPAPRSRRLTEAWDRARKAIAEAEGMAS